MIVRSAPAVGGAMTRAVESTVGDVTDAGFGWLTTGARPVACDDLFAGGVVVAESTAAAGVRRGVGKSIGVTATTIAVRSSAIKSLLSIYGTGS